MAMTDRKFKNWDTIYKKLEIVQKKPVIVVKKFVEFLLKNKKSKFIILDQGCGPGRHTLFLIDYFIKNKIKARIDAFDNSKKAISILKKILSEKKIPNDTLSVNCFVYNLNKKLPYRRYQIGEVFRDEPVSSNRLRQFVQCDADIIGSTIKEDAEILAAEKELAEMFEITSRTAHRWLKGKYAETNKDKETLHTNNLADMEIIKEISDEPELFIEEKEEEKLALLSEIPA